VCMKIFKCPRALKLHVCSYTGEKPFTCDVYNKTFKKSVNFSAYLRTHTGERQLTPFTCHVCKKS